MRYEKIVKAKFIDRPNRFVALVEVEGKETKCHVKNTGRCRELLVPGASLYLEDFQGRMGTRSMRFSLIGVEKERAKGTLMINMDSQAPNKVVKEALEAGSLKLPGMGNLEYIKGEATYGSSRLDFFVRDERGQEGYIEVKGVTLENNGIAMFPDAPTERGVKHLLELAAAVKEGMRGYALFVIQMKGMTAFHPNDETHKEFGDTLRRVAEQGVLPLAYDCEVGKDWLKLQDPVDIEL